MRRYRGKCRVPDPARDAALVRAAQGGDSQAFEMLHQVHGPCTCGVIADMLGGVRWNVDDRKDAFQATWTRLWEKQMTLRDGAKFCAFARSFAALVCLEKIRDPWRRRWGPLPEEGFDA